MPTFPPSIEIVDSHTGGEPTRLVVDGWPQPEGETMEARRADLAGRWDHLRQAVVCEPRGHDAIVGGLLTPAVEEGSEAGVIFFNNASYLGMCGHGLIGMVRTLEHLGRLEPGSVRIDTPVGTVSAQLHDDGAVTIENVPARCERLDVELSVPGVGPIRGDIAWGGNWFFLAHITGIDLGLGNLEALTALTKKIRRAVDEAALVPVTDRELIHIEIFGEPARGDADSKNFVLCPGGDYDRSPCGTGVSAKLAVMLERGEIELGERWRQESITGSLFTCWLERRGDDLVPFIRGRAWVTARSTLLFDPDDELAGGISTRASMRDG